MSQDKTKLHKTTGIGTDPSIDDLAMCEEDRELAEKLIDVLEGLPTISEDELVERENAIWKSKDVLTADSLGKYVEKKYKPAALDLPGFGEEREDCGVDIPHICDGCGCRVDIGRTCAQSMCPRCGAKWVLERAPGIVSRIWSAAKMKSGAQYLHHVAAWPPRDVLVDAENPEEEIISTLQDFERTIDFDGLTAYHPWKGENDDADSVVTAHNDDQGEWSERLFNGRQWEGDVREELEHRPHFHLVGACEWFPGGDVTSAIHAETGWLFHRIARKDSGVSIDSSDLESLASVVCYVLSHTGIDTRGERNQYVHGKIGSAYHNADGRHDQAAKEAVYKVAPKVLGIPSFEIDCPNELDVDDVDADALEELSASSDGAEDDEPTEHKTVPCNGDLVDVDDADFVDDEEWRQTALFAEDAVEAREEWQRAGGWRGWTDREQEAIDDVDGPPPP